MKASGKLIVPDDDGERDIERKEERERQKGKETGRI
jgi:hypothetical protein